MKTMKKLMVLLMTVTMVLGLTACGGGGVDGTYSVIYDNTMDAEILEAIPENQFMKEDVREAINAGLTYELTLILEITGDYTLVAHLYNPNQKDTAAADYLEIRIGYIGTYTIEGDVITIEAAEMGDASFYAGSDYAETYKGFSFAADGSNGDWYSDSTPELLDLVSGGTITVSETTITGWEVAE